MPEYMSQFAHAYTRRPTNKHYWVFNQGKIERSTSLSSSLWFGSLLISKMLHSEALSLISSAWYAPPNTAKTPNSVCFSTPLTLESGSGA